MKNDKLEEFVFENIEAFDEYEANPKIWTGIQSQISAPKKLNLKRIGLRIAATIAIFIASYFVNSIIFNNQQQTILSSENTELEFEKSENIKLLLDAEAYYSSKISTLSSNVFQLSSDKPEIRTDIETEFLELDNIFKELKHDLKDNAANEEVLQAMIQNYRIKLEILTEILEQLNKSKNKKNKPYDNEI